MRSVLVLKAGIRVNPAETEWKWPLRHIAQFLLGNVGLAYAKGKKKLPPQGGSLGVKRFG